MSFLTDPIIAIGNWLTALLSGWGLPEVWVNLIVKFLGAFGVANFGLLYVILLIWIERKLAARIQDRLGPNRAGPYGILQTLADILKLFTKEDTTPSGADKVVFNIAPILSVFSVVFMWAVIPLSKTWLGTDLNVGVLFLVAAGSFGVLAILMAGWSANNKFALLGAFRTVAQLVSYEVPMVIALLIPVLLARSMGIHTIVDAQQNFFSMFIFLAPVAALIFFVSSIAEVGRTPFDLLEAESEIVAGFHIEYSGAKFAMIFAGEFLHAFTISVLTATLFLGGWRGPGAETIPVLGWVYFMAKSMTVYFIVVLVRSTLPRIRIDQMLDYNWKLLTPVALITLMVTALLDKVLAGAGVMPGSLTRTLAHLAANVVIILVTIRWMRTHTASRVTRTPVATPRPVARPPQAPAPAAGE